MSTSQKKRDSPPRLSVATRWDPPLSCSAKKQGASSARSTETGRDHGRGLICLSRVLSEVHPPLRRGSGTISKKMITDVSR